jgi:hypothetical protein
VLAYLVIISAKVGRLDRDLDEPGGEEALDGAHRVDERGALRVAEGLEQRAREVVAAAVDQRPLPSSGVREADRPDPAVRARRAHRDEPVALEAPHEPAEVPRVEVEPRAERAQVGGRVADLPEQP